MEVERKTKRSFRAPKTIRITLETKSYKNSPRNCLKFDLNKKIHAFSQNILGRTPSDNRILLCGIIKKCRQEVAQTKKQTRTRAPCVPSKDLPLFTDRFTKSTSCGFFFFPPLLFCLHSITLAFIFATFSSRCRCCTLLFCEASECYSGRPGDICSGVKKKKKKSFSCSLSFIFFYSLLK